MGDSNWKIIYSFNFLLVTTTICMELTEIKKKAQCDTKICYDITNVLHDYSFNIIFLVPANHTCCSIIFLAKTRLMFLKSSHNGCSCCPNDVITRKNHFSSYTVLTYMRIDGSHISSRLTHVNVSNSRQLF